MANLGETAGEGGEGRVAKCLILLGEGSGEGGEGHMPKSLKSFRRRLAKVAKRRTPHTPQRVMRARERAHTRGQEADHALVH